MIFVPIIEHFPFRILQVVFQISPAWRYELNNRKSIEIDLEKKKFLLRGSSSYSSKLLASPILNNMKKSVVNIQVN